MGRARLDGDVPLGCIRPSVRTLESGSPSRVDISLRSRRSSLAGRTPRILADVIPPKTVDRGPTTDVNRGAQGKLDINCGWNGQRLRKSTTFAVSYTAALCDRWIEVPAQQCHSAKGDLLRRTQQPSPTVEVVHNVPYASFSVTTGRFMELPTSSFPPRQFSLQVNQLFITNQ